MALKALAWLFDRGEGRGYVEKLYQAIVARARAPHWYQAGEVPDTVDGRFDLMSVVLSLVLVRLETVGDKGKLPSTLLAERFVEE